MKKFTQKMKSVLFSVLSILAMAVPANANVTGVSDLFGKYKFSATIEYTEAGKAYEGQYKESSDVTIERHDIYDGQIVGLAGRPNGQLINNWDAEKQQLMITNPSQGGVWGDLYMANAEGDYPWNGIKEGHNGAYSAYYTYNEADGSISIPDFTLGQGDYQAETFTVFVKFTNVKLELVELEKVDVADLSGSWHYNAGKGKWDSMEGSSLPTEFDMTLVAKNAEKTAYTAQFVYGDFAPVNIDAEFNGSVFSLNLDSTALDASERIYMICSYSNSPYKDKVTFNYTTGGSLNISSGMTIVRCDSIAPEKPKAQLQWFQNGVAKRQGGDASQLTWEGTYKMSAKEIYNLGEGANFTKDFKLVIEKDGEDYFITEILGYQIQPRAMMLKLDETDSKKATIALDYYGLRILEMVDPGKLYRVLGDKNAEIDGPIVLTLNDDNTLSIENCCVLSYRWDNKTSEIYASLVGVKGAKENQPDVPEFTWAQTFHVTADVDVYNKEYEFPTEFNMTVVPNEYTGGVMLTEFLGGSIADLNYGGAGFTIDENDPMKAAIAGGATVRGVELGKLYMVLGDVNAQANPIHITADASGNLTFDNFSVLLKNYQTQSTTTVAYYKNVKATLVATGIEKVQNVTDGVCVDNGVLRLNEAQAVAVYNFAGQCVFNGVAAEIKGLAKGLYIVKTAAGAVKVSVK